MKKYLLYSNKDKKELLATYTYNNKTKTFIGEIEPFYSEPESKLIDENFLLEQNFESESKLKDFLITIQEQNFASVEVLFNQK